MYFGLSLVIVVIGSSDDEVEWHHYFGPATFGWQPGFCLVGYPSAF